MVIDYKRTIKNIHNKFPEFTLDQLLDIMECIVEESIFKQIDTQKVWQDQLDPYRYTITCNTTSETNQNTIK